MMKLSKIIIVSLAALFSLSAPLGGDLFIPGYEVPVQERDGYQLPTLRYLDLTPGIKWSPSLRSRVFS